MMAFYQNFWIDGRPHWTGIQLDEVAFPVILAWRLRKLGALGDQGYAGSRSNSSPSKPLCNDDLRATRHRTGPRTREKCIPHTIYSRKLRSGSHDCDHILISPSIDFDASFRSAGNNLVGDFQTARLFHVRIVGVGLIVTFPLLFSEKQFSRSTGERFRVVVSFPAGSQSHPKKITTRYQRCAWSRCFFSHQPREGEFVWHRWVYA